MEYILTVEYRNNSRWTGESVYLCYKPVKKEMEIIKEYEETCKEMHSMVDDLENLRPQLCATTDYDKLENLRNQFIKTTNILATTILKLKHINESLDSSGQQSEEFLETKLLYQELEQFYSDNVTVTNKNNSNNKFQIFLIFPQDNFLTNLSNFINVMSEHKSENKQFTKLEAFLKEFKKERLSLKTLATSKIVSSLQNPEEDVDKLLYPNSLKTQIKNANSVKINSYAVSVIESRNADDVAIPI